MSQPTRTIVSKPLPNGGSIYVLDPPDPGSSDVIIPGGHPGPRDVVAASMSCNIPFIEPTTLNPRMFDLTSQVLYMPRQIQIITVNQATQTFDVTQRHFSLITDLFVITGNGFNGHLSIQAGSPFQQTYSGVNFIELHGQSIGWMNLFIRFQDQGISWTKSSQVVISMS